MQQCNGIDKETIIILDEHSIMCFSKRASRYTVYYMLTVLELMAIKLLKKYLFKETFGYFYDFFSFFSGIDLIGITQTLQKA